MQQNPVRPVSAVAPIWRPTRLSAANRLLQPEVKNPPQAPSVDLLQQVRRQPFELQKGFVRLQQPQWVQEQQQRMRQQQDQHLQRVREWQQQMQTQLQNQLEQARTRFNQPLSANPKQGEWKPSNYVAPLPTSAAKLQPSTKTASSPLARQQWERRWTTLEDNQLNRNQLNVERERAQDDGGNRRFRFNMQFARTNVNRAIPVSVRPATPAPAAPVQESIVEQNQTEQIAETTTLVAGNSSSPTTELPLTTSLPNQTNLTFGASSDEEDVEAMAQNVTTTTVDNLITTETPVVTTTISSTSDIPNTTTSSPTTTAEFATTQSSATTTVSVTTESSSTTVSSSQTTTTVPSTTNLPSNTTTQPTVAADAVAVSKDRLRLDKPTKVGRVGKGAIINGPRWMLYSNSPASKRRNQTEQNDQTRPESVEAEVQRVDRSSLQTYVPRQ